MDMEKNADHNLIEYILSILDLSQDNRKMQMDPSVTMQDTTAKLLPLVEAVYMQTAREIKNFMDKMPGGFLFIGQMGKRRLSMRIKLCYGCLDVPPLRNFGN